MFQNLWGFHGAVYFYTAVAILMSAWFEIHQICTTTQLGKKKSNGKK
jgi:hypothetical protein